MKSERIRYKEVNTFFFNRTYNIKYGNRVCPLCNKKIYDKDNSYLIINNYRLFPNLFVHKACVKSKIECVEQLVTAYEEAKRAVKKYSFWFKSIQQIENM